MKARYDSSFDNLLGYKPIEPRTQAHLDMIKNAIVALDKALKPAPKELILKVLARLKISTVSRRQDEKDARYERGIYVEELTEFPLDVVEEACQNWCHRNKWSPSVFEIRDGCQWLVRFRRITRDALAQAVRHTPTNLKTRNAV